MSSDGTTYFNDMLGTTLSSSANGETTSSSLTAFGAETHNSQLTTHNSASDSFFTGKPFVPGLGHAFLFRNYRSDLGKWQTADPLGYPDGWTQLAYCGNGVTSGVDLLGELCIFTYDKNNYDALVLDKRCLVVGGGCSQFDWNPPQFRDVGGQILIDIKVSLNVSSTWCESDAHPSGSVTEYKPHTGANIGDAEQVNGVYEAVLAHERGHRDSFYEYFLPRFRFQLVEKNIDSYSGKDPAVIQNVIDECYAKALTKDVFEDSTRRANQEEYLWFVGHKKDWTHKGKHDGYDMWVKGILEQEKE